MNLSERPEQNFHLRLKSLHDNMKKHSAIKNKSVDELKKLISEKKESLRNFRFGLAGSKIRNVKEGRGLRKEIARMMTEVNGRNE